MAACKRRQENKYMTEAPASPASIQWTLPMDLLLEIVARSDTRTLVRCAAASRLFRHDILVPSFIHRVTGQGGIVPRCILALLNIHDDKADPPPPLSMVHPTTAAAVSFLDDHMSPYMSRFADDLLREHIPVMSRGGLVLLRRRHANDKLSNLCVYDPITGRRTFLSDPPDIGPNKFLCYHLLTSEDGIDCPFLLFVANPYSNLGNNRHIIQVQTATSTCGTWAPAASIHESSGFLRTSIYRQPAILHGAVIHWLVSHRGEIVTYNICTMEQGTVQLPPDALATNFKGRIYLGSYYSNDGHKLLRLLAFNGFKISMWHQLTCGDWASGDVTIDMEEKLKSIDPDIVTAHLAFYQFRWYGEGSNTLSFRICRYGTGTERRFLLIVLDLEAKEVDVHNLTPSSSSSVLLDVDLPSRLRAMKLFPYS